MIKSLLKIGSWGFEGTIILIILFSKLLESTFYKEISKQKVYWLATSGGRVPVVAVCVLHGQLRIFCVTDSAVELKILNWPFCKGFPNSAAHTS